MQMFAQVNVRYAPGRCIKKAERYIALGGEMKNTRRDWRLDAFIGQEVEVEFDDGKVKSGILGFHGFDEVGYTMFPGNYYLKGQNEYNFRKSHVLKIKAKGENEKWVKLSHYKKRH